MLGTRRPHVTRTSASSCGPSGGAVCPAAAVVRGLTPVPGGLRLPKGDGVRQEAHGPQAVLHHHQREVGPRHGAAGVDQEVRGQPAVLEEGPRLGRPLLEPPAVEEHAHRDARARQVVGREDVHLQAVLHKPRAHHPPRQGPRVQHPRGAPADGAGTEGSLMQPRATERQGVGPAAGRRRGRGWGWAQRWPTLDPICGACTRPAAVWQLLHLGTLPRFCHCIHCRLPKGALGTRPLAQIAAATSACLSPSCAAGEGAPARKPWVLRSSSSLEPGTSDVGVLRHPGHILAHCQLPSCSYALQASLGSLLVPSRVPSLCISRRAPSSEEVVVVLAALRAGVGLEAFLGREVGHGAVLAPHGGGREPLGLGVGDAQEHGHAGIGPACGPFAAPQRAGWRWKRSGR